VTESPPFLVWIFEAEILCQQVSSGYIYRKSYCGPADKMKLQSDRPLGKTGILAPGIIFGTSYLGNLYRKIPNEEKLELIRTWFECAEKPVMIDSAGKYGAGLALEMIGEGLRELGISPDDIVISNKLGWYRIPLKEAEPTFEPGAWAGLKNDAIQTFGYGEILMCFEQGNELLGLPYSTGLVSVHDPDEYLKAAENPEERVKRMGEILESYRALFDLREKGRVKAVGIGSKDWTVIAELYEHVPFDWVMFANSFTIFSHPGDLLQLMDKLNADGVGIINSALFHGGFLTGSDSFDYTQVNRDSDFGKYLYNWREAFFRICSSYSVVPADACLHFGISHPAITCVALNTSKPEKMRGNADTLRRKIPAGFWTALKKEGLIDPSYPYV
jgi:D-threo-aldose 1-dehydrogenase